MTRPKSYLARMMIFLALVAGVAAMLWPGIVIAFSYNPALNGLIFGVLLIGIGLNLRQVAMLGPEAAWVEGWQRGQPAASGRLRLLAPMASMLGERHERISLSAMALRSLLDSIAARLDESRELARYMVGLLIFLGLLGTFWGLSQTIGSVGEVIRAMDVSGQDPAAMFESLKTRLELPLAGMGTAFSTSMIGLAGSLVLGFLDLQAGRAQNTFYNELEEWLSAQTRLGAAPSLEGASAPAYLQALLEQTADSLDSLQRLIVRSEENRQSSAVGLTALVDKLSVLADHMRVEQSLMLKVGEGQVELRQVLARLVDQPAGSGIDEASLGHLRSIDNHLQVVAAETKATRTELVGELRQEFRLLARTIAAVAQAEPGMKS
ncbi:flagellar motor protein MotA [Magnetospirillum moscoviense]|uniref:Flagellar motor protein MotA n=1 Tax=Magnetospirillum moscoviense TaxID=1437059 RepID=A0A178MR95_9PROT|nr:flagellar motor protein MotA [Magnetospirillum moscoviense]OAN51396.1 flagellar motor protein MotA [Magnetospirillum moscoviense]